MSLTQISRSSGRKSTAPSEKSQRTHLVSAASKDYHKLLSQSKKFWLDLNRWKTRPRHRANCICDLCSYYEQKKGGQRFGKRLFIIAWLIHRIKINYLLRNHRMLGKRRIAGQWAYEFKPGEYDRAPFRKEAYRILDELYYSDQDENFPNLKDVLLVYAGRTEKANYRDMKEEVAQTLYLKGRKTTGPGWRLIHDAHRIARFIREKPLKEATRSELERRLKMTRARRQRDLCPAHVKLPYHQVQKRAIRHLQARGDSAGRGMTSISLLVKRLNG